MINHLPTFSSYANVKRIVLLISACILFHPAAGRCSAPVKIEFSNLANVLPWEETPSALNYRGVKLHSCRETLMSSERWLDILVKLGNEDKVPGETRLVVRIKDRDSEKVLFEDNSAVTSSKALVRMDMRSLGIEQARLRVEWTDKDGKILGIGETWISADPVGRLEPGTRIPVKIDLPEGVQKIDGYPVRFGVPMPAGALWTTEGIRVVDSAGREIPSQLEIAGRWAEEGAVKWLWVDALVTGKTGDEIYLEQGDRGKGSIPSSPVVVKENRGLFTISTGDTEYVVGIDGALVKEIRRGNRVVAGEGNMRGLYVIDQKGRLGKASAKEASMKLESAGPVSAVIRIEGFYRTAEGEELARHITRLQFYAGRQEAAVTHTLILTRDTNEIWFKDIGWEFDVSTGNNPVAFFSLSAETHGKNLNVPLDGGKTASMLQKEGVSLGLRPNQRYLYRWNRPEPSTQMAPYMHGKNVFEITTGSKAPFYEGDVMGDWAALAGKNSGLMLSCRDAAAQHPKEFEINGKRLNLKLFSSFSGKELDFRMGALIKNWGLTPIENMDSFDKVPRKVLEDYISFISKHSINAVGWAKTHELLLSPFTSTDNSASASRLHSGQVFGHVSPEWIRKTGAIGAIHPRDTKNFPLEESVIDRVFWRLVEPLFGGPKGGFIDYHAGPHVLLHSWRSGGYSVRSDSWYLYARSGDREIREFAQGTNRAFLDNNIAHCNAKNKTLGLFVGDDPTPGTARGRNRVRDLPLYWQGTADRYELTTVVNLDQALLDYYLTGYRRAGDIMSNFASAARANLKKDQYSPRIILALRHLMQAYEITWEPRLKELIYEITEHQVYDPDSPVLLSKARPHRSSTYKMETDTDTLIELWNQFHDPLFYRMAKAIGKYAWAEAETYSFMLPNVLPAQNRASGLAGHFLWKETGDPSIVSQFDYSRRRLVAAVLNSEKEGAAGVTEIPKYFLGLPMAMDILSRTGGDKNNPASWLAFNVEKAPISIFFNKPGETRFVNHSHPMPEGETSMELLVRTDGKTSIDYVKGRTENGVLKPWASGSNIILKPYTVMGHIWAGHDLHTITEKSSGVVKVNIPRDAPGGPYELVLNRPGEYTIFSNLHAPMALYAPEGWIPPVLNPPVKIFFRLPENVKTGRIFLEKETVLFTPEGKAFNEGLKLKGWVELPEDKPGLWSFESIDAGLVKTENLPGFFAMGDPSFYMEKP